MQQKIQSGHISERIIILTCDRTHEMSLDVIRMSKNVVKCLKNRAEMYFELQYLE